MARFEHDIVATDEVPTEGSKLVEFFGRQVHVVLGADGAPSAFMDACLHLGGPLTCSDGQFRCQWHGATFDLRTGKRTGGPAPRDSRLMRLPTIVDDGVLKYVWDDRDRA